MAKQDLDTRLGHSIGRYSLAGFAIVAVLTVGLSVWATLTPLSGAVIAPGHIAVESSIKKVQHQEGGIVSELVVSDGVIVEAGDVLVRLSDTVARASLDLIRRRLEALDGLEARLKAERKGEDEIVWSIETEERKDDPFVAEIIADQAALIRSRRASIEGRKTQLKEQVQQIEERAAGLVVQRDAKVVERQIIEREYSDLKGLHDRGLVSITRVNELERAKARLGGELGRIIADIAAAHEGVAERRIQIIQIEDGFRSAAMEQLQEIRTEIAQLRERMFAARDRLERDQIRAPRSGIVHNMTIHTVGGVVAAGEILMEIVPQQDRLIVSARVAPVDIDQVSVGQKAAARFTSLNRRTTPEVEANVMSVSADLMEDPVTGTSYFKVTLQLDDGASVELGLGALIPGMPVEAFIKTTERSALSYLIKPISDQIARAFKES